MRFPDHPVDDNGESEADDHGDDISGEGPDLETDALVTCPYCGEECAITLDPGGGGDQEYVEDCPVCCRPWSVVVTYSEDGAAEVRLTDGDGG
jgi:Cysteine-rich CPXCG